MNILKVAVTGTNHYTEAEIHTGSQVKASSKCSKRRVTGYVVATGTAKVNCPKCLAA
jgi:hypothetical protein